MKDRQHFRRNKNGREENTLAVDVAGRFKIGLGPEGSGYKYLLVSTFDASKQKWKDLQEEKETDEMKDVEEKLAEDPEYISHPQEEIIIKMLKAKVEPTEEKKPSSETASRKAEQRIKALKHSLTEAVKAKGEEVSSSDEGCFEEKRDNVLLHSFVDNVFKKRNSERFQLSGL